MTVSQIKNSKNKLYALNNIQSMMKLRGTR